MVMPVVKKFGWTRDEVERLVDARDGLTPRYELVDGELLVTPAPTRRHQRIIGQLYALLRPYVMHHRLGELVLSPAEVNLTPESRFEPDLFVDPAVAGRLPRASDPVTQLLLAIEVLSPGSRRHDRITKRRFFQRNGVREYWIVDGDTEAFEIWHPADDRAALIDDELIWHPEGAGEPFVLDVKRFFADVADEPEGERPRA